MQNRQSADMGQHNVQHNKVNMILPEKLKGLAAIIGRNERVARGLEIFADCVVRLVIVLNNQ